ncbi:MAG: hypothetical protein L0229_05795 [Blastocatellia bacterium]|nr:hypothetical protein [Blastocatellia bacterium]
MFRVRKRILTAFILTASLVTVAFGRQSQSIPQADTPPPGRQTRPAMPSKALSGQQATSADTAPPGQQPRSTPKADAPASRPAPEYVEEKGFKGKIFDVKHRDPGALVRALAPLGSGFKGATIRFESSFKTITVRDFPENIAVMEEALKRLDMPQSPQPNIELRMHVLIASNIEGAANQYPAELSDVVKQLQGTLNYKSYYLATSILQRIKDGTRGIHGEGNAQLQTPLVQAASDVHYEYGIRDLSTTSTPSGGVTTEVDYLSFRIEGYPKQIGTASIQTSLNARDGEKVVVGTASLKDKAMILVLTAKVIK